MTIAHDECGKSPGACDCPASLRRPMRCHVPQSIHVSVPLRARPKGSKRHVGGGRMIEMAGENLTVYRASVGAASRLAMKHMAPLTGPVEVLCTFTIRRPKKHYTSSGTLRHDVSAWCYPGQRGDLDKLERATYDALNGIAYQDDAQIVHNVNSVVWGFDDRTDILIRPAHDPFDAWAVGVGEAAA